MNSQEAIELSLVVLIFSLFLFYILIRFNYYSTFNYNQLYSSYLLYTLLKSEVNYSNVTYFGSLLSIYLCNGSEDVNQTLHFYGKKFLDEQKPSNFHYIFYGVGEYEVKIFDYKSEVYLNKSYVASLTLFLPCGNARLYLGIYK